MLTSNIPIQNINNQVEERRKEQNRNINNILFKQINSNNNRNLNINQNNPNILNYTNNNMNQNLLNFTNNNLNNQIINNQFIKQIVYNKIINNYNQMIRAQLYNITNLKMKLNELLQIGKKHLLDPKNINHYLIENNNFQISNNYNNNTCNNNNSNCFLNNSNNQNNRNKENIQYNQTNKNIENVVYLIKEKTNDTSVEIISKIEITTTYKTNKKTINNLDIQSGKEKRTYIKLVPIPPNYKSIDIIKLLDKYLTKDNKKIYNVVYTPHNNGVNLGYCFINFIYSKYIIYFNKTVVNYMKKNIDKSCKIIWANKNENEFLENIRNKSVETENLDVFEFYE